MKDTILTLILIALVGLVTLDVKVLKEKSAELDRKLEDVIRYDFNYYEALKKVCEPSK